MLFNHDFIKCNKAIAIVEIIPSFCSNVDITYITMIAVKRDIIPLILFSLVS